ncbi:MAG: serine/threonine protein kinase [Moraxellaceae bacterium]|jgi:serine/threonine-protein kinase|nr:serine/threonine protein kinase [Moraxellaceae bacterium]
MRKGTSIWKSDWLAGTVIVLALLFASVASDFIDNIENYAYDLGVRASAQEAGDKVAIIAIDDRSIENLGRWPWPRTRLADMIKSLQQGGAKAIGLPIILSEPQLDPGLVAIRDINKFYSESLLPLAEGNAAIGELGTRLGTAEATLNTDQHLADAMGQAGNVVLPMQFVLGEPQGNPDRELPAYVTGNQITAVRDRIGAADAGLLPPDTLEALPPIALLGEKAAFIGHVASNPDADGTIRNELLLVHHHNGYYPSLALMLAAKSLNLNTGSIAVNLGEGLSLGKLKIKTDPFLQMRTYFYGSRDGQPAFSEDSFFDVASGKIPVGKYKDKIVIIGPTAYGLGSPQVTPISAGMEPARILAHNVASILNQNFFVTPDWGTALRWGLILMAAAFVIAGMSRLKAGPAAAVTFVFVLVLVTTHFVLMKTSGIWVQLMLPAIIVSAGYVLITTKHYFVTEKAREKSEVQSAESNRQLGLALQQTGQLDMAFEKFRKCPMDESMADVLYNLALDYERKRQFNKAVSVYQAIADFDPKFRDLSTKLQRAQKLEETVILGGGAMSSAAATMILTPGSDEKPMLGRYQVEKELGKGAMGVVYLGRDPKINRVVAIKTMALKDEFEGDELVEIKERFFREAETAGRLNHPNIVTIYDAGEEHDLAYIAMEFLHGHDLARYVKPDALLPVPKVVNIVYKAALALDYAHQHNVVHRDIKPANIMFDPDKSVIKITDFGIARITDASKTKTGTVLGTPTYMSPEQVAGKKVDGRSDLYSLGVMFYQMLSGTAPFRGESMATLMYKIANEPHASVFDARPELADMLPCIAGVIDKALAKEADERYQTGKEFAVAIKACVDSCKKDSSTEIADAD